MEEKPILKDAYADFFHIGTAVNHHQIAGHDEPCLNIVTKHFSSITAENVMKWEFLQPRMGEYDFKHADAYVEYGEQNGMFIIGHALVWHSQVPRGVFNDEQGNQVSREVLLERMRDHIYTVVGRYKGRVHGWDVVNEAINEDGTLRQSKWMEIIGEDYIQKAFEYTHEADPDAELYYNDYNLAVPAKRDGVIREISKILENGVPVHGIGMQGHIHLHFPDFQEFEDAIKAYADLGVNVMVTELDLNMLPFPTERIGADVALTFEQRQELNPYPNGMPDSLQNLQVERYIDLFEILLRYSDKVMRVTFWGVHDGLSWLNNWPIRGRTNYPLLFDRELQPKPVFFALIDLAEEKKANYK